MCRRYRQTCWRDIDPASHNCQGEEDRLVHRQCPARVGSRPILDVHDPMASYAAKDKVHCNKHAAPSNRASREHGARFPIHGLYCLGQCIATDLRNFSRTETNLTSLFLGWRHLLQCRREKLQVLFALPPRKILRMEIFRLKLSPSFVTCDILGSVELCNNEKLKKSSFRREYSKPLLPMK
jgi:hypothetical protein